MKKFLLTLVFFIFMAGVVVSCRMDNKNNTDYSNFTNEDKANNGLDTATRDHTDVANDSLP